MAWELVKVLASETAAMLCTRRRAHTTPPSLPPSRKFAGLALAPAARSRRARASITQDSLTYIHDEFGYATGGYQDVAPRMYKRRTRFRKRRPKNRRRLRRPSSGRGVATPKAQRRRAKSGRRTLGRGRERANAAACVLQSRNVTRTNGRRRADAAACVLLSRNETRKDGRQRVTRRRSRDYATHTSFLKSHLSSTHVTSLPL